MTAAQTNPIDEDAPSPEQEEEWQKQQTIAKLKKRAAILKTTGTAQEQVGKGVEFSSQFFLNAGRALIQGGIALASTIIGIILTIILVPMGAVLVALGLSAKVAGKTAQITGKATKTAGRKAQAQAAQIESKPSGGGGGKTGGLTSLFSPLNFADGLIKSDSGPAGFVKTLLPSDEKSFFCCCFVMLVSLIPAFGIVVILLGLSKYMCESNLLTQAICAIAEKLF